MVEEGEWVRRSRNAPRRLSKFEAGIFNMCCGNPERPFTLKEYPVLSLLDLAALRRLPQKSLEKIQFENPVESGVVAIRDRDILRAVLTEIIKVSDVTSMSKLSLAEVSGSRRTKGSGDLSIQIRYRLADIQPGTTLASVFTDIGDYRAKHFPEKFSHFGYSGTKELFLEREFAIRGFQVVGASSHFVATRLNEQSGIFESFLTIRDVSLNCRSQQSDHKQLKIARDYLRQLAKDVIASILSEKNENSHFEPPLARLFKAFGKGQTSER